MCSPVLGLNCCWVRTGHSHWAKLCSSPEAAHSSTESAQLNSEAEPFSTSTVTLNQTHRLGSWLRAGAGYGYGGGGVCDYFTSNLHQCPGLWHSHHTSITLICSAIDDSVKTTSFNVEQAHALSVSCVCVFSVSSHERKKASLTMAFGAWLTYTAASQVSSLTRLLTSTRGHPRGLLQNSSKRTT